MKRRHWIIATSLGLTFRLALVFLPIPILIAHTMPDDAFIYFVIARNIAAGLGATFDGVKPTNGFHPLWALLIAPIFRLIPNGDLPVHLVLTLGAVCDVVAGWLGGSVVGWVGGWEDRSLARRASLAVMALYLFNPRAIQESANGLETGLTMMMLSACVAGWAWLTASPELKGRAALFGALAGLSILARSDVGLIVGVLSLWLVLKKRWTAFAIAIIVAVAVVAPWFAWSWLRVGTVVQSSAVAIPSLVAYRIQSGGDVWGSVLFPIINYSFRYSIIYPGLTLIALLVGALLVRVGRVRLTSARAARLWLPLIGALLIVFTHTFVRWYPRSWYFAPLAWSAALAAGPMLTAGLATPIGKRFGVWIAVGLGLIVIGQSIKMIGEPEYQSQSDMRAGAEWLAQNTSADETAGAFNAGIYAYYSERRVLSLDGLVDWDAIEARREKRLLDYFVGRGGTLIIDHEAYAIGSFSPFFGARTLEAVAQLPTLDDTYGPIVVYAVK